MKSKGRKFMGKFLISLLIIAISTISFYLVIGHIEVKPPSPQIIVGEKRIKVAQGSYCWEGFLKVNKACTDTSSPPFLIEEQHLKPISVSPESDTKIEFSSEPNVDTLVVKRWINHEETEEVLLNGNVFEVPKDKGVYTYEVFARWKKGDSSHAFVIEVC
jgi:hypothetical protein